VKFSAASPLASRTVATWFTLIGSVVFLFAGRALIAQVLGPFGLGLYALLLTAAWLGGTVLSLGLPTYNASFAGKQPPGVLLSNAIAWNAAAFVGLTAVCAPWLLFAHPSATRTCIIIGVWMAPFVSLLECTRGVLLGTNVLRLYNWLGLSGGTVNLVGLAVLAATSRLTLVGAVICWIVATVVTAVLAVTLGAAKGGGLARVHAGVLRESLRFGGQAWLSQLTGILNFRIALLLTEALLGTAAVGIYAIAVTIAEVLFYFPNSLAVATVSRYASASRPQAGALLSRSIGWVLAVSTACAVGLAVAGGPFIAWVFGPSYAGSFTALLILLPGVVLYTPVAISAWFFNAHVQKPGVNLLVAGSSALVNGLLTLLWAPRYGLTGVAWATTTAYVCASVLNVVLIGRELRQTSALPAYVEPSGSVSQVTRLTWRTLRAVDFVIAVGVHLVMPRRLREGWFMPGTQLRNRRASDAVYALLDGAPRSLVLDVGGGAAALAGTLGADPRVRVVTLDLDLDVLRRAATRAAGLRLVCADATRLPFADDTFDAIVMVHALEHIPMQVRGPLAAEIQRVSRRGVVIHGPAGDAAVTLSQRLIEQLSARGVPIPRYAFEHLDFSMPMPAWFSATFPGCDLRPRRNFDVELATIMTEFTPLVRWLSGYRHRRMVALDDRPPFVEYTMTWRKSAPGGLP
jgi:O-antigen/teichoic acid export membrane protein/SAM-dependent methyltransferase